MKKMKIAVAMAIAVPAAAFAQATPATSAPAPAAHAGHDAKAMNCKDMHAGMSGNHSGHQVAGPSGQVDHSKMNHGRTDHTNMAAACGDMAKTGASQAPADSHANHKQ